ncbi:MAG TPA: crosslink repair DNA glycosylase YcaQ family protein [Actinomycetota bacterium]|nr:crosslink repair DNA glycosylase YcaQ family protein [Actinomycetota bacterium]
MQELSISEARALAAGAQGFGPRPSKVSSAHILKLARRLGVVQLDSVNALSRAHYLPFFSRLGPYSRDEIDAIAYRKRKMFEYWGHEASLLPIESFPLFKWKMDSPAHHRYEAFARENKKAIEAVVKEIRDRGPLGISGFAERGERSGPWWGWPATKGFLEYLFVRGRVTTFDRKNFERIYDLTERVIPEKILDLPVPKEADARKSLLLKSAAALGVGTAYDLGDYFRFSKTATKQFVKELAEEGQLNPVRVEGWKEVAYSPRRAGTPAVATALLGPFDSMVWDRARVERMFGMRYRIEIYTPAPKREFGYYVLPFMLQNELVARVDLKADRQNGALWARGAYAEAGVDPRKVAAPLAEELSAMAGWLNLERVKVEPVGTLAEVLRKRHFKQSRAAR